MPSTCRPDAAFAASLYAGAPRSVVPADVARAVGSPVRLCCPLKLPPTLMLLLCSLYAGGRPWCQQSLRARRTLTRPCTRLPCICTRTPAMRVYVFTCAAPHIHHDASLVHACAIDALNDVQSAHASCILVPEFKKDASLLVRLGMTPSPHTPRVTPRCP